METKVLIQDVQTRWNSLYDCFRRFLELKSAVSIFVTVRAIENSIGHVSADEWKALEDIVTVLSYCHDVTLELSSERQTTSSKAIPIVFQLFRLYQRVIANPEIDTLSPAGQLAMKLNENLHSRFESIESKPVLAKATLLDPRFRKRAFRSQSKANVNAEALKQEMINMQPEPMRVTEQQSNNVSQPKKSSSVLWSDFYNNEVKF